MKTTAKISLAALCAVLLCFVTYDVVRSHCEIPCGIYGDTTRIDLLYEDIATVEKSMRQITALSADPKSNVNQLVRWVNNKEEHANKIQHIVTQYFMTQRCKPKGADDTARGKYIEQITALHGLLIHAMKAKQTTDTAHCKHLRDHVKKFSKAYFSAADLKHIEEHQSHK
ncbi:MAG: superoxide dismutase [Ni] [Planctomycetota bacterium]